MRSHRAAAALLVVAGIAAGFAPRAHLAGARRAPLRSVDPERDEGAREPDGMLREIEGGNVGHELRTDTGRITQLQLSPTERLLFAGTETGVLRP